MTRIHSTSDPIETVLHLFQGGSYVTGATVTLEMYDSSGDLVTVSAMSEHGSNGGVYLHTLNHSYTDYQTIDANFIHLGKVKGNETIVILPDAQANKQAVLDAIEQADKYSDGNVI